LILLFIDYRKDRYIKTEMGVYQGVRYIEKRDDESKDGDTFFDGCFGGYFGEGAYIYG
jgi:hypothetical protein